MKIHRTLTKRRKNPGRLSPGECCPVHSYPRAPPLLRRQNAPRPVLSRSVPSGSLQSPGLGPASLLCPWNFQARILEWVTISSFRGSSLPRDGARISYVSCISGRFFSIEPPGKPKCTHSFPKVLLSSLYTLDS